MFHRQELLHDFFSHAFLPELLCFFFCFFSAPHSDLKEEVHGASLSDALLSLGAAPRHLAAPRFEPGTTQDMFLLGDPGPHLRNVALQFAARSLAESIGTAGGPLD